MAIKRFHSRRSKAALYMWAVASGLLLMAGLVEFLLVDTIWLLTLCTVLILVGLAVVVAMGKNGAIRYEVGEEQLTLHKGAAQEGLSLAEVVDANLIDRMAARDYVRQRYGGSEIADRAERLRARRDLLRYCSSRVASGGLASMFAGLFQLGEPPMTKMLVLVRVIDGRELLLSPRHSEQMVSSINKMKAAVTA